MAIRLAPMAMINQKQYNIAPARLRILLLGLFLAALAARMVFVIAAPLVIGDGWKYILVAENIFHNGCVSVSPSEGGACKPHWGGNQMPGYPFFVASVWTFFGQSTFAVLVVQAVLAAATITWLGRCIWVYTQSHYLAFAATIPLAISPLQIAWSRHIMTESLVITLTIIIIAELVRSLKRQQLQIWTIAPFLIAAFYVRYDSIILCLPIALTGFLIHRPWQALRRGVVLTIVVAIPVGSWLVRNVAAGLTPLPNHYQTADGSEGPMGYISWINTWNASIYDAMGAVFPVATKSYSLITIPDHAYRDDAERRQVGSLLKRLEKHDKKLFPAEIDQVFDELAKRRRAAEPMQFWLINPLKRTAHQWLTPFAGFGWPSMGDDTEEIERLRGLIAQGPMGIFQAIGDRPWIAFTKGLVSGYRYGLLFLAVLVAFASLRYTFPKISAIVWIGLVYAFTRTILLSYFNESRYLVGAVPGLEIAVGLSLMYFLKHRPTRRN